MMVRLTSFMGKVCWAELPGIWHKERIAPYYITLQDNDGWIRLFTRTTPWDAAQPEYRETDAPGRLESLDLLPDEGEDEGTAAQDEAAA